MATHRLLALSPGRRCVGRNPDGSKLFVEFTPEYCRQQYQQNNAMIRAGIPVPVCWDHRDDKRPGRLSIDDWNSERVKGTAGHVEGYEIDSANKVWTNITIPDTADAKKAETVRFCSPEIDDFTDGNGKHWGEVFTHIALTPRPVQHEQPPIVRLSLTKTGPIRLALDPSTGADMADEKPKDDEKPKGKEGDTEPADDEDPETGDGFKSLVEALREAGLNIPDEVTDNAGLIIAIKASAQPEDDMLDPDNPDDVTPAASAPIALGHKAQEKQLAQATGLARKGLAGRVQSLVKSRRITPTMGSKMLAQAGKVQLSFNSDGDLKRNELLIQVEAYEALPKGTAFQLKGQRVRLGSEASAVEPPEVADDDDKTEDEKLKAWDDT